MANKLIVVVGSGPGIGVALLARNEGRLQEAASRVSASASKEVKVKTYSVDIGDHSALRSTLDKVNADMGPPEVVLFNAARVAPSEFGDTPLERLSEDFAVMNIGLYVTAEWAVPQLEAVKQKHPDAHTSFLITGGGIWQYPQAWVFALAMQKAAQVNFAGSLLQIAGPKGIHVATICVNGPVEDKDPVLNAKNVATKFWGLYGQKQDDWESMIDVGVRQ